MSWSCDIPQGTQISNGVRSAPGRQCVCKHCGVQHLGCRCIMVAAVVLPHVAGWKCLFNPFQMFVRWQACACTIQLCNVTGRPSWISQNDSHVELSLSLTAVTQMRWWQHRKFSQVQADRKSSLAKPGIWNASDCFTCFLAHLQMFDLLTEVENCYWLALAAKNFQQKTCRKMETFRQPDA